MTKEEHFQHGLDSIDERLAIVRKVAEGERDPANIASSEGLIDSLQRGRDSHVKAMKEALAAENAD